MENREIIKELEGIINGLKKSSALRMENESKNYPAGTDTDSILNNVRTVERELLAQTIQSLRDRIHGTGAGK
jgi:hypothetical protein